MLLASDARARACCGVSDHGHDVVLVGVFDGRADGTEKLEPLRRDVGLGEKDQSLEWLHKAYEQYSHGVNILRADSRFNGLRSDPRFADLLRRLGLPP